MRKDGNKKTVTYYRGHEVFVVVTKKKETAEIKIQNNIIF